jgi:DNA repair exonuclease SbcCD ATPase subunit
MRWTSAIAYNFLSFEEVILQLQNRGLVLVEGKNLTNSKFKSNGSGKSSLLEPLVYGIYGVTSKGLKADEVINLKHGKGTVVVLEGYKGDDLYRIERYRKHPKHKNKVFLFANGKDISKHSTKETEQDILKLVGLDYNTFVNSVMFSQGGGAGRFAIATDKEKKEILENLVNLDIYAKAQTIAKARVDKKENELKEKDREKERLDWELSQVDVLEQQDQQRYESTKQMIEREQANIEKLTASLAAYKEEKEYYMENTRKNIITLTAQRDAVSDNSNLSNFETLRSQAERQVQSIKNKQYQLTLQKDEIVKKYRQIDSNSHCPVCGNELDPTHRDQEKNALREQLKPIMLELQSLQAELPAFEEQFNQAHEEYTHARIKRDGIVKEYQKFDSMIKSGEQGLKEYEDYIRSYNTHIQQSQNTLEKLQAVSAPQPRTAEREAIREKTKVHKHEVLQIQKELDQLKTAVKAYSNSGIKSHVLDLVTPFLNKQANQHLSVLSGTDMEITFTTQTANKKGELSDKFDVQLTNAAGGDHYKANSEGEKKRADLAISLALQDHVLSREETATNFVVYDEVFDALDSVGIENVVTLLRERLKVIPTIFVITHSETLKPLFDKVITVVKNKDGVSTLKEGAI